MPFVILDAKKVVLNNEAFVKLMPIITKKKGPLTNWQLQEVYQLASDSFMANNTLIVILSVNGQPSQFIHLWGEDIQPMLDDFNPQVYSTTHRVRLDQHCRIDGERDTYYTRY